jgi:hypothetical protein
MDKLIVSVVMVLLLDIQTAMASEQDIQALCAQQFLSHCMDKCQETNDINCTQACEENAHNQCRQAGE